MMRPPSLHAGYHYVLSNKNGVLLFRLLQQRIRSFFLLLRMASSWPIYLYVPNLIGYARILANFVAFGFAFSNKKLFAGLYLLSFVCDELDGRFARLLNQTSTFGAVLDMVTDRVSTCGLLVILTHKYSGCYGLFLGLLALDIASHWFQMYRERSFSVVYMDFALSETSAMEMEVSKRQKTGDCVSVVAPMEAATTSSHPLPHPELFENAKGELEEDWQQLLEFANSLLHDYAQSHGVVPEGLEEDDVSHAPIDTKDALRAFTRFTDNACILFVTGRLPSALLLRRWLNAIIKRDIVEEIFEGPRGFYEVLFKSMQVRNAVLESVPLFYEGQLVHTVPWRPLAEFQDILKQECPIWVEV
ncbi:hypothetical protein L7F22_025580 [Adiantum nelumboides]|nr:hypothetical protein [Adiantum nelumboides]